MAATASLLLWAATQLPKLSAVFLPRMKLVLPECNSTEGAVIYNAGDVPVFVSRIVLRGGMLSQHTSYVAPEIPIKKILRARAVLNAVAPTAKQIPLEDTFWTRGESRDTLAARVTEATVMRSDQSRPCNYIVVFSLDDPKYRLVRAEAGATLNEIEATGFLEYESLESPERPLFLPIPSAGAILSRNSGTCRAF